MAETIADMDNDIELENEKNFLPGKVGNSGNGEILGALPEKKTILFETNITRTKKIPKVLIETSKKHKETPYEQNNDVEKRNVIKTFLLILKNKY